MSKLDTLLRTRMQAALCGEAFRCALAALQLAAAGIAPELEAAASEPEGSRQPAWHEECFMSRLHVARAALKEALFAVQQASEAAVREAAGNAVQVLAGRLRHQLQPAAVLAAVLQEHFNQPQWQAAVQLDLARIAAARSCAYLRCSNLAAGGGGPGSGEGDGSRRCSACRAVWYCSKICSHADWRAGHRKVCKALAAERQAAKVQQEQA
jgi:hypothetical protein